MLPLLAIEFLGLSRLEEELVGERLAWPFPFITPPPPSEGGGGGGGGGLSFHGI